MLRQMFRPQVLSILSLTVLGLAGVVGAIVTAGVTGNVPHDLVGLVLVIVGYLVGFGHGRTVERLAEKSRNGHDKGPLPPAG